MKLTQSKGGGSVLERDQLDGDCYHCRTCEFRALENVKTQKSKVQVTGRKSPLILDGKEILFVLQSIITFTPRCGSDLKP